MSKKMRYLGYVLFMSGTILFGIMHLAIALYVPSLGGWSDPPGLISTVLSDTAGRVPYILSIIFMIIGIIFIVGDLLFNSSWWQKQNVEIKEKNQDFTDKNGM